MTRSHSNSDQLQSSLTDSQPESSPSERIERIGTKGRDAAIQRLVAQNPRSPQGDPQHARNFLEFAQQSQINLVGLWSLFDAENRISATVLTVPNPGKTAMVFASHPFKIDRIEPLSRLLDHACEALDCETVDLAQTLLEPGEALERKAFLGAGFTELATLSYLERSLRDRRSLKRQISRLNWPDDVQVVAYEHTMRDELIEVMNESYVETQDCPGLYGLRRTEDILAGHQATGRFEKQLWILLRVSDRPAGALLLNPCPIQNNVELVYIGLAHFARGRGLGTLLIHHGLGLLGSHSADNIHLAVDECNTPALKLYQREGFRRVLRRVALIRPVHH